MVWYGMGKLWEAAVYGKLWEYTRTVNRKKPFWINACSEAGGKWHFIDRSYYCGFGGTARRARVESPDLRVEEEPLMVKLEPSAKETAQSSPSLTIRGRPVTN